MRAVEGRIFCFCLHSTITFLDVYGFCEKIPVSLTHTDNNLKVKNRLDFMATLKKLAGNKKNIFSRFQLYARAYVRIRTLRPWKKSFLVQWSLSVIKEQILFIKPLAGWLLAPVKSIGGESFRLHSRFVEYVALVASGRILACHAGGPGSIPD